MSQVLSQICPDGHRCENGSMCSQNPYDEGGYYCDCDEGNIDAIYSGLYCEHKATSFCTFNQEVSAISFCTNSGNCKVMVSSESAHLGCECPTGYEGDHCQFVEGSKPDSWPFNDSQQTPPTVNESSNGGLSGGVTIVIVIIVLSFWSGVAYMIYRKKYRSKARGKHDIPSSELVLEADGETLKESMRASNGKARGVSEENEMEDIKLSEPADGSVSEII
jgi:hypothetical protein